MPKFWLSAMGFTIKATYIMLLWHWFSSHMYLIHIYTVVFFKVSEFIRKSIYNASLYVYSSDYNYNFDSVYMPDHNLHHFANKPTINIQKTEAVPLFWYTRWLRLCYLCHMLTWLLLMNELLHCIYTQCYKD